MFLFTVPDHVCVPVVGLDRLRLLALSLLVQLLHTQLVRLSLFLSCSFFIFLFFLVQSLYTCNNLVVLWGGDVHHWRGLQITLF